ncbi:MAG: cyclic pyranopterin monophosphate synthase MoaC [Ectobacillus sp.]
MGEFTHFNEHGKARMVDISEKKETARTARAASSVIVSGEVYEKMTKGEVKKGDVLSVAQVAGIMGAKKTADIIPMCHPLSLTGVDFSFRWEQKDNEYELHIESFVKTKGSTGVEMEALTAVSICALTIYDMCKAIDKGITIGPTYLVTKTGGKTGDYHRVKA